MRAVCDGHSYEYAYDEQGKLREKRSNGKRLVSYAYDRTGKIKEIKDPAGVSTCYEYDILGRVSRIHSADGMEVSYGYDSLDRLESIRYGNGVQTTYAYDCDGNISHLETKTDSAVLLSFSYQYDGNGNRTAKTGTQGLTAGSSALEISYRYDVRGQLLEERRNNMSTHYAYDAAGNRISKKEGEKETRYHYNAKNQLLREENAGGIKSFAYDRQGGIVEEKSQAGTRRFTYNSHHQQTRVETETGSIQENRYDAEGLRYELLENGRRTGFVYHNGELLHEKGEGLSREETSYHLGAGIEAFQRNRETFYYHQDEQMNTTLISDGQTKTRNQYRYDAFGTGLNTLEGLPNRIRYTGQQYDQLTEQYYLRARYYNPVLGRFMQEDVYQGDGLNLYAYCQNNPVTYYDPSGYDTCEGLDEIAGDGGKGDIDFVDDIALKHSTIGDFTYDHKTGQVSRMKGGGHGQSNIDFLEKNGIEYNIIKEYENGVRVGNVPKHKTPSKRTGTEQAWFPQNWSDSKIKDAGNFIANLPENKNLVNGVIAFGEYDGVRVGIIKTDGRIGTIFPDADLQPCNVK